LVKLPKGTPAGALDAAMRRAKDRKYGRDDDPDQDRRLGELRRKLEEFLANELPSDRWQTAKDLMDEFLPGGKVYGDAEEVRGGSNYSDDADPDGTVGSMWPKYPDHAEDDREKMREFMESKGCTEDEIESVLEKMPRSAMEGGMGGRTSEDRRRRGAMDRSMSAEARFDAMFGTGRIKTATSFR
jgi:hypothetical protein